MSEHLIALKRHRVNFWTKVCLTAVSILLVVIGIKINVDINELKVQVQKAEIEYQQRMLSIEQIKSEIAKLPENPEDLDEATIRKIAKDELNLCDSDVVIFANSQPN